MLTKDSIWVTKPKDELDFGLRIDKADEDGWQIVEVQGKKEMGAVYFYKRERKKLIECLQELLDDI